MINNRHLVPAQDIIIESKPAIYYYFKNDLNSASLVLAGYTRHQSCRRIVILQSIDNAVDPVEARLPKG